MVDASEQPAARSGRRTVLDGEGCRRLGHEVDAIRRRYVGIRSCGFARQGERVTDIVGHVLDFRSLVVVARITALRFSERRDLFVQCGVDRGGAVQPS